jgi:tRNA threonylcarbamoyladenosine biosynthesis protein TsaB
MLILVIDTSTDGPAVGLADGSGRLRVATVTGGRRHGRDLVPAIRDLLAAEARAVSDLGLVGVGVGPGSFTGLRIGLTAAKVLAYASGAELVPFDSLEGMAQNAPDDANRVSAVGDAQRGDVHAAEFGRPAPGEPLTMILPSRILPLGEWAAGLEPGTLVLGPGLASPAILGSLPHGIRIADHGLHGPRAESLTALVLRLHAGGLRGDLWTLEPNYLRRSAAEDQWDARSRS